MVSGTEVGDVVRPTSGDGDDMVEGVGPLMAADVTDRGDGQHAGLEAAPRTACQPRGGAHRSSVSHSGQ